MCYRPTGLSIAIEHPSQVQKKTVWIDLIVIAPSTEPPLERRMELRRMLAEYDRRIGLDLLVYTPDEFNMLAQEPSSFISSALKQGSKIYDREAT